MDEIVTEEDNDLHIIVPDYIPIKIERILDSEGRGTGVNMLNPPTTRTLLNLHIIQSDSQCTSGRGIKCGQHVFQFS